MWNQKEGCNGRRGSASSQIFLIAISVSSKLVSVNITVDDEPIETSPKFHSVGGIIPMRWVYYITR